MHKQPLDRGKPFFDVPTVKPSNRRYSMSNPSRRNRNERSKEPGTSATKMLLATAPKWQTSESSPVVLLIGQQLRLEETKGTAQSRAQRWNRTGQKEEAPLETESRWDRKYNIPVIRPEVSGALVSLRRGNGIRPKRFGIGR